MLLFNHDRLLCNVDALLGTFGIAQFTANTLVRHEVAGFLYLHAAKGKVVPFNRKFGEVEPFTGSLIDFENCERAA